MICPYIINISLLVGSILSWGIMWLLIENREGDWYKSGLPPSSLHGIQGYRVVCTEGPDRIRELIAMGASFDHGEDGNLHLAREGGHSHRRIVYVADMIGREIERALLNAVVNDPNISVFEHHFVVDLLTSQDGPNTVCHGADVLNTETKELQQRQQSLLEEQHKASLPSSSYMKLTLSSAMNPSVTTSDTSSTLKSTANLSAALSSSTALVRPSRVAPTTRFGSALNIETLVAAAE